MKSWTMGFLMLMALPAGADDKTDHPCLPLRDACKEAGFQKNGRRTGKGGMAGCMAKVLRGEDVEGVSVDKGVIAACQARRDEMKEKRSERRKARRDAHRNQ